MPRVSAGNPDVLICGNCRELFTDLGELIEHRKSHCKLRFACKCRPITAPQNGKEGLKDSAAPPLRQLG